MKIKKATMRAEINKPEDASEPESTPVVNYEFTVLCTVCKYKVAKGGLDAPANLNKSEVLNSITHNPRCPAPYSSDHAIGVSNDVITTETSNVTNYLIFKV